MGNSPNFSRQINEVKGTIGEKEAAVRELAKRLENNSYNVDVARINQTTLNANLKSEQARLDQIIAADQEMAGVDKDCFETQLTLVQHADPSIRLRALISVMDQDKPARVMKLEKVEPKLVSKTKE